MEKGSFFTSLPSNENPDSVSKREAGETFLDFLGCYIKPLQDYGITSFYVISPDNRHVDYVAETGDQQFGGVDGKEDGEREYNTIVTTGKEK
jgi:hypothetical protein